MRKRTRQRKSKVGNKHFNFTPIADTAQKIKGADIWLLDFSTLTENQIANLSKLLSPEELTRAQTFKHKQHDFVATRALVRKVLAHYTSMPTSSLEFARREEGKPYLTNAPFPIYFNLSHSGSFAVLAVSTVGEIGVDIETIRARNFLAIAERYYHADELKQLMATPEAEREQLFFKLWTLKEAFFKATGGGISSGLNKAVFAVTNKNINAQLAPELNEHETAWQFQQTFLDDSHLLAVALNTTETMQTHYFDGSELLVDA